MPSTRHDAPRCPASGASDYAEASRLFASAVTAGDLAEPLVSFGSARKAAPVRRWMEKRDFRVAGVRPRGSSVPTAWVRRDDLVARRVGDHAVPVDESDVLDARTPLFPLLRTLRERSWILVRISEGGMGIVTRADIQKTGFRMWLFGLVSLVEIQMLRMIRGSHPGEWWRRLLTAERVAKAEQVLDARRRRDEATDLAECLQFGDKATIIRKTTSLRDRFGFRSVKKLKRFLESVESLRDQLAHSSDIDLGDWDTTVGVILELDRVLQRLLSRRRRSPTGSTDHRSESRGHSGS